MTEDQYLDALGVREGLTYAEPPHIDQPTAAYGITLGALALDRGRPCTVADLKALSVTDCREIARRIMRRALQQFGFNRIADEHLRIQLLDFAHNSGDARAIRWLQRAVGLRLALVTGVLDERTLAVVNSVSPVIINNALVAARLDMIDKSTAQGTIARKFEDGLESRALSFGLFGEV